MRETLHGFGGRRLAWRQARRCARTALIAVSIGVSGAPSVGARQQQPPPQSDQANGQVNVTPAQIQDLFESYVMMQAQRQLRLTDQQLPQFIIRLKALQNTRRRAENQRLRLLQELRQLTQAEDKVDEAQVRDRLKALDDLEMSSSTEIKQAQANLDQVLDVRQQARFRILELQIERNKIDLVVRARQQRAARP
jgi:hypothetical protein